MNIARGIRVKKAPFFASIIIFIVMEIVVGFSDSFASTILRLITCAIFCFCIYRGTQEEMLLNPYFLFCLTPFTLLIYSEKISTYYLNALETRTWLLAVLHMGTFLLAYRFTKKSRPKQAIEYEAANKTMLDRMKRHAIILAVIGRIPTFAYFLSISIPLSSIIGFFSYIGIALAFKSRDKRIMFITILISSIMFIEDFNKTRLLYMVMTMGVCAEMFMIEKRSDKVKLVLVGIAASLIFVVVSFPLKSYTRNGGNFADFIINFSEISSNAFAHYNNRITFNGPAFLRMPYMYLVTAWNNLQYVMTTQNDRTYGLWMLKPLLGYLQIDGRFSDYYELIPASTFNTFTYITVFFKDFGYVGSLFGSVFLGAFVKKARSSIKKDGSAFSAASYALVGMATFEMFFSNHFFSLSYPFTIIIIGWIYKKVFHLEGY